MGNYLFNLKFTVSETRLKMLCHVALIWTIYCITDIICTVACQEIEVVRFFGLLHLCLFLNYVNQTTKSNLSKKSEYGIPKTKDKLTTIIIFFISNKTRCACFNPLCQTYLKNLLPKAAILRMYDLFFSPSIRVLKTGNCQGKEL